MQVNPILVVTFGALLGCAATDPLPDPPVASASQSVADEATGAGGAPVAEEGPLVCEDVASASEASTAGDICMGLCTYLVGLGCTAVMEICTAADVVTVGAVTVPCGIAAAVACIGGPAALVACGARLCPK